MTDPKSRHLSPAPFAVSFWSSHPDDGNDDCNSGDDFDTLEAAEEAYNATLPAKLYYVAFIELTGRDGLRRVRANPAFDAKRVARDNARDDRNWRQEQAMEAGMLHGVEAYNETMGWD